MYVCSPGSVGKSPCCLMVAASISRGYGHTSDAATGAEQRPAATATTAATTAAAAATTATAATGPRIDRPLHRQPNVATRSVASQSQQSSPSNRIPAHLQLKQIIEPQRSTANLLAPISPTLATLPNNTQLYLRNKRFRLWGSTRTALSTLFRTNVSYLRRQRKQKKSWISFIIVA